MNTIDITAIILSLIGMASGWLNWYLDRRKHRQEVKNLEAQAKTIEAETRQKYMDLAKMNGCKVVLSLTDDTPLMLVVNAIGFSAVGGFLGMSQPITESAAAWVHSRDKDGDVTVSTQYLFVDPAVYASYQGQEALNASVNSYGGTSKRSVARPPKTNQ